MTVPYAGIDQATRTLAESLAHAVSDGLTTEKASVEIHDWHQQAATLERQSVERYASVEADPRLTPEGKVSSHTEDAKKAAEAFAGILGTLDKAVADDVEFQARAPHLRRLPDGTFSDVRSTRRDPSPDTALLLELKNRQRWEYLAGLDVPTRGAALRRIADSGEDADGLLQAALDAPEFLGLLDASTKRYIVEATLRNNGLIEPLEQSAFKAGAAKRLSERIRQLLADLGLPAEKRSLERV